MPDKTISILHIASDEKFINAAYYIFEKAFPECNRFLIPHSRFNRSLKYVKVQKNMEVVSYRNGLVDYISKVCGKYDCIFLHGITAFNGTVFLASPEKHKFIGILWGAELYTEENFPERGLKGELTAAIKLPRPEETTTERIKALMRRIVYGKSPLQKDATRRAALELSYLCVPYEEEFSLFRERKLISERCRMIPFTYYPLEYIMKGNEQSVINGNDILLGNSASYTNNHLEAFQLLRKLNTGKRKIVVPLSYGNTLYADYIQSAGKSLFDGNFRPLREFMPLNDYTKEIMSCGIVIMNQFRQQAIGNILTMLWLGSRVYLSEHNTFYHYLKRIGVLVFSVEKDLTTRNTYSLTNISKSEIEKNRTILRKAIGQDKIIKELQSEVLNYFQKSCSVST